MVYEGIEFFNVSNLEKVDNFSGLFLNRFPGYVQKELGYKEFLRGRYFAYRCPGGELRFKTEAAGIYLSLSAWERDGKVEVYYGDFFHSEHAIPEGKITTIELSIPQCFLSCAAEVQKGDYGAKLWRVVLPGDTRYLFHGMETFDVAVMPPEKEDVPSLTWLAYGSSITFGSFSTRYGNSYIAQAARRLHSQVMNMGMPGACYCDEAMVEYLANIQGPDFYFFEIGINMCAAAIPPEEYEKMARNLLFRIWNAKHKPMFVTGVYPTYYPYENRDNSGIAVYNEILPRLIKELGEKAVVYIPPEHILDDVTGLTCDLLHPSDDGHIRMGEKLANVLRAHLAC